MGGDGGVMDQTLVQILRALVDAQDQIVKMSEQIRVLQADYVDLKNKAEDSRSGANKSV